MRQFLLIGLFMLLLTDIMLGLGLSLLPGLSLKNALLYILFTALVLEFVLGERDPLRETWPLHVAWFLLLAYATFTWLAITSLGLHREYDPVATFIALKSQFVDLFLFLLVYLYAPRDATKSIGVLRWLIGVLVLVNVITFIDVVNIPDLGIIPERHDGRITGPVREVNQYGAILVFMIPLMAGLALSSSGIGRGYFVFGAGLSILLLGLTVSRGSYVGLIVGTAGSLFLARDYVNKRAILKGGALISVVLVLTGITIAIINPEGFLGKFEFQGADVNQLSSGRLDVWQRALTKMSYWPLSFMTGYGWEGYRTLIGIYGDPHNTYMQIWFNLGFIGIGLYLFITLWIIRYAVNSLPLIDRELRPLIIGFLAGFASLHVTIFFVALYTPWLFIWALTGTALRVIVDESRNGRLGQAHEEHFR